jgi:hypothetical protein
MNTDDPFNAPATWTVADPTVFHFASGKTLQPVQSVDVNFP